LKPLELAILLLLAAIWGASFLFIRVASPAFSPVVLTDVRVLLGGGVLLLYALLARQALELGARCKDFSFWAP
jgi:drug/metabolite transporter (DMT)-like permease